MRGGFRKRFTSRGKGAPVYTDRDHRTWSDLADAALRIAENPTTDKTGKLEHRAWRKGTIMPVLHREPGSPFAKLHALARLWPGLDAAVRIARAAELKALAAECREILDAYHRAPPPPRADLEN